MMTEYELREAYYKLACLEVNHRCDENAKTSGRPYNREKLLEVARLLCMEEMTLYEACKVTGQDRSTLYRHKLRFIELRSRETKQGNRERKFYSYEFKLECVERLAEGFSQTEVMRDSGVTWVTLKMWYMQYQLGKLK